MIRTLLRLVWDRPRLRLRPSSRSDRLPTDAAIDPHPRPRRDPAGTTAFFDGYPSAKSVDAVYDNLDFQRGVRAFLDGLPIASLYAMREGFREVGAVNGTVGIFETLMDARTLFLTANTESVYAMTWLDLRTGRWWSRARPTPLGILDDFSLGT